MKSITINGSQRESVGKAASKTLRNAGKVPCVLYGGDNPIHFSANELAFSKLVYTPDVHTVVIDLENGGKFNAIVQDLQFHPVTDKILHADFFQLHDDKEVTLGIPVKFQGTSPGILAGGVLSKNKRKLNVRALPKNLPDFITADISEMKIGNKLYVTEVANDDYTIMHPDNTVICQVRISRAAMKASQEAANDADLDDDEAPAAE
ncbi:50S ribosomal protein L25/general stress protein Ctc [Flavobacteriaceae bacterium R38]|nr:50S ribosomal protein L25/general stress protein Ctc [Flavobacteriaceae bacterium R38]